LECTQATFVADALAVPISTAMAATATVFLINPDPIIPPRSGVVVSTAQLQIVELDLMHEQKPCPTLTC